MEELIKKIAEAFRDYVLNSDAFRQKVEEIAPSDDAVRRIVNEILPDGLSENVTEIVDARLDYHGLTGGISGKIEAAIDDIDWDTRISDNLDTSSVEFRDGVRDVIRNLDFRVEVY